MQSKPEHQRIELGMGQAEGGAAVLGPDQLALVQASCRQPDADSVVHQDLHPVRASVGEQVGVMRARSTEEHEPHVPAPSVPACRRRLTCLESSIGVDLSHV